MIYRMPYQIHEVEALRIIHTSSIGGNQKWFHTHWQRCSGCGPTTVSNIIAYQRRATLPLPFTKVSFSVFMEEVWRSVTPTNHGIPSASLLLSDVNTYMKRHGYSSVNAKLDVVPKNGAVSLKAVDTFLHASLDHDVPVAFLSLDPGKEPLVDEWHWVTLIGIDEIQGGDFPAMIIDNGTIKKINLGLWLSTTREGGGFASFVMLPA